jgi:hypothetical protein
LKYLTINDVVEKFGEREAASEKVLNGLFVSVQKEQVVTGQETSADAVAAQKQIEWLHVMGQAISGTVLVL